MRRHDTRGPLTDEELLLVARVAAREGWEDLARPPVAHGGHPRSLGEAAAVERFAVHATADAPGPRRRPGLRLRLGVAATTVGVLGACWWVSPARTAIALIGAGLFCLIALRRGRRRTRRPGAAALGR